MKIIEVLRFGREEKDRKEAFHRYRMRILSGMNLMLTLLGLVAVVSLIAEYGFSLSEKWETAIQAARDVILYGFAIQAFVKIFLAENKKDHLRKRWGELVIFSLILFSLMMPELVHQFLSSLNPFLTPESVTALYVIVTQAFILVAIIPSFLRASRRIMTASIQPSTLLAMSFVLLILFGTGLLLLPKATVSESISFIDALFTATSAVTTTGLIVVDTGSYFTPLGQGLIILLLQVGGLGIMTFTTFFAFFLSGGPGLKEYAALQDLLAEESLGTIRRTILLIVALTLTFEIIGSILLLNFLPPGLTVTGDERVFFSVFHSISAFCTGGFSLLQENFADERFRTNLGFMSTIMGLVVAGSLGFPVFLNVGTVIAAKLRRQSWRARVSVHTKIVLICTALLFCGGSTAYYVLERTNTLEGMQESDKMFSALFQSVSASTTVGFNSLDITTLGGPALFLIIVLMTIGGSPASTAGGMKTTTAALAFLNVWSLISGRQNSEIFGRRLRENALQRAFSTVLLAFFFIGVFFFLLLLTEKAPFQVLLFEVVSALGTVGLSAGHTSQLTTAGKLVIIVAMFVGRIGFVAFLVAIVKKKPAGRFEYPEENVLVT